MYPERPRPTDGNPPVVSEEDRLFLERAMERFHLCAEAENEYRLAAKSDLEFYDGDQWPDNVEAQRAADNRPCLTINRLPQFVHQVTNEVRQNKPSPKVSPVDDYSDIETAEIIQGLYRHVERQSKADAVRSYAAFYQVVCGRGYYRILTEHVDPFGFDQEIFIRRIKNPMTVYMDPTAQEPDKSDAKWAFIVEDVRREDFKLAYPNSVAATSGELSSVGDGEPDWATKETIRVAEYFCKEIDTIQIALLGDGSVVPLDQVLPGTPVVKVRTTEVPRVEWHKITADEVLERKQWPGKWIPIIPCHGEEYDVDGKTKLVGMVRNAKDPQRMLNYWESAKTETIALAPRSPYIAAEGQIENHEKEWAQANTRNWAYLTYKPTSLDGTVVGPPQRQVYEPPIQAITVAEGGAVDHLKATTGIYDASLGNRSNETSGIAIRQRQSEGDTANFHYTDNLAIAINHEARIMIDLIPKIYDRPGRVARIIGEDDTERKVVLNARDQQNGIDGDGLNRIYDLNVGRYDVAVDIGPSYKTKRQESVESMLSFAQVAPGLLPRFGDLFVKAMDWPMAREIADRIRPPDVQQDGEQQKIPPQAQAMIQQLSQQNQQLTGALNAQTEAIERKQYQLEADAAMQQQKIAADERMKAADIESKERIAAQQVQADAVSKAADIEASNAQALLGREIVKTEQRLDQLEADQPVKANGAPERPPLESFEQPY